MAIKNVGVISLLYLAILWTGCSFERPLMESSLEVRMLVPQGSSPVTGKRALAPETAAMRVELWQSSRLMFQVTGGVETQNDGKVFVVFSFGQVPLGTYELVAYAVDTNRVLGAQDIQVARGVVDLTLDSPSQKVTLVLRPNDMLSGNVQSLEAGLGSLGTPIPSKQSLFYKLSVPIDGLYLVSLGLLSGDTELIGTLQDKAGKIIPLTLGKQSLPWSALDGPLYLSIYNGGLIPKPSLEVFYDLAGSATLHQWDGLWKPLDTGGDLVSLVGVPGKFAALDYTGVLLIKETGFWEKVPQKPPVRLDLITTAGNLIVAATKGFSGLYTFDGVSWTAYTTIPGGSTIHALTSIPSGVVVLDETGMVRIFDGLSWTSLETMPLGTTSLGAAGDRLFAWNVKDTVLWVWEGGRWADPGFPIQIGTRSLTGSTDTVIALVKN